MHRPRRSVSRSPLLAALLALASLASGTSWASDGLSLDDANRRWRGARCRSRQEISLKGSESSSGWTKSNWLWWGQRGSNHRARLLFENARALEARFRGRLLPPGTEFDVIGWDLEESGGSAFLEVAVAGLPVRAKLYFYDDWVGQVGGERLDDFERWVRFEVFEILETPEESLTAVPSDATAPVSAPRVAAPRAATTPSDRPRVLALRLLAVTVEPARVVAGSEVRLVATYSIEGTSPGEGVEVEEHRIIRRAGETLTSLLASERRTDGLHQSTQTVRLPPDAGPGVHELRVVLRAAGATAEGTAIFEVRGDAR